MTEYDYNCHDKNGQKKKKTKEKNIHLIGFLRNERLIKPRKIIMDTKTKKRQIKVC